MKTSDAPGQMAQGTSDGEAFLRITEIFHSIQGESTWAGLPCTFIRLTGCPLRCVWCDTEYAFHGGERMTFSNILAEVERHPTKLVEVTGGEPLAHPGSLKLTSALLDRGYTVLLETSGAFDVSKLDVRVHKIMDLKCPGSGECDRNLWENLDHLTERDEIKFVVADLEDLEWAIRVVRDRGLDDRLRNGELRALLISPVWDPSNDSSPDSRLLPALAERILATDIPFRFQVQLHKTIWGPGTTGV